MSDGILSGLDTFDAMTDDLLGNGLDNIYVRKSDVTEALLNPTDEQVDALARVAVEARFAAYRPTNQTITESPVHAMVRAVLAAAAGGDE